MAGLVGFAMLLQEEGKRLMQSVGGTVTGTPRLPGPSGQEMGTGGDEGGGEILFGPKGVGKGAGRREGGGQVALPLQKSRATHEGGGAASGERSLGPQKEGGGGEETQEKGRGVGGKSYTIVGRWAQELFETAEFVPSVAVACPITPLSPSLCPSSLACPLSLH